MPHRTISLLGVALVVLSAFLTSAANLLFRAAMTETNSLPAPLVIERLLHRPTFYAAWVLYAAAAIVWFRVLKTEPLSSGYPILMGVSFVVVSIGALWLFREEMSLLKAAGMAMILLGIVAVSRS